jgi:hypothetical protein
MGGKKLSKKEREADELALFMGCNSVYQGSLHCPGDSDKKVYGLTSFDPIHAEVVASHPRPVFADAE